MRKPSDASMSMVKIEEKDDEDDKGLSESAKK